MAPLTLHQQFDLFTRNSAPVNRCDTITALNMGFSPEQSDGGANKCIKRDLGSSFAFVGALAARIVP